MERRYYRGAAVGRAIDVADLRHMARRRLPAFVREYLEGGAEDEDTLDRNRAALREHRFVHRALVDVSTRSLTTTIFGRPSALPLAIGPTGFNGLLWKRGDVALARAARAAGVPFAASTVASDRLEAIAEQAGGRLWFQLYVMRDPATVEGLVARAERAGCEALIVTVDAPVLGNRTWDQRNYARPMQLTLRAKLDVLAHVRWLLGVFLPRGLPGFGNLSEFLPPGRNSPLDGARYMGSQLNTALSWTDVERMRARWPRKLIVKGVVAAADVERAIAVGCDAVVLSNHGGRQLDGEVAPIDVLPAIAAAYRDRISIFVDGGFRRGGDVAKAIALGAHAVLLGRATLYGLAAGGEAGATRALQILTAELDRTLTLLGCPTIAELGPRFLAPR